MTNKEMYELFCSRFDIKPNDYRPLAGDMFIKGREGITIFCDNGDILLYFPNCGADMRGRENDGQTESSD